jgi:hypothetical protein
MTKFNCSQKLSKLVKARRSYESAVEEMASSLSGKIQFEYGIEHQLSDGFVLLDVESGMHVSPLADCISVIYTKGALSSVDHRRLCI